MPIYNVTGGYRVLFCGLHSFTMARRSAGRESTHRIQRLVERLFARGWRVEQL